MEKEIISVWVSQNMTSEYSQLLFADDLFFKDFSINRDKVFFDEDYMIVIYPELGGQLVSISKLDDVVNGYPGLSDCWDKILRKLQKLKVEKINYILAVPDFKYSGKIKSNEHLLFVGNFTYEEDLSYLDKYSPDNYL